MNIIKSSIAILFLLVVASCQNSDIEEPDTETIHFSIDQSNSVSWKNWTFYPVVINKQSQGRALIPLEHAMQKPGFVISDYRQTGKTVPNSFYEIATISNKSKQPVAFFPGEMVGKQYADKVFPNGALIEAKTIFHQSIYRVSDVFQSLNNYYNSWDNSIANRSNFIGFSPPCILSYIEQNRTWEIEDKLLDPLNELVVEAEQELTSFGDLLQLGLPSEDFSERVSGILTFMLSQNPNTTGVVIMQEDHLVGGYVFAYSKWYEQKIPSITNAFLIERILEVEDDRLFFDEVDVVAKTINDYWHQARKEEFDRYMKMTDKGDVLFLSLY